MEEKNWATGPLVCRNCGHDDPEAVHVYYLPSLPVECPECGEMAMRPPLSVVGEKHDS